MRNTRRPYCRRVLGEDGVVDTEEHVFVQGLGGRCTVRACRDCNSRIGHEIEGKLQGPGTLLAIEDALRTGVGPVMDIIAEDGQQIRVDLQKGDYRAITVVISEEREGDELSRRLSGPPEQVKAILEASPSSTPTSMCPASSLRRRRRRRTH